VSKSAHFSAHRLNLTSRLGEFAARPETRFLAALVLPTALLFIFIKLASEVVKGETLAFDKSILLALRVAGDTADPIGPPWFESVMRDLSALGSAVVLTIMTLALSGFLFVTNRRRLSILLLLAVSLGTALSNSLKFVLARPRPDLVAHVVQVHTMSFPSGHAMLSAVTYLTIGALLAHDQSSIRVKTYILGVAVFLSCLVGISRVYLGVHYPTDVLAGWALGGAWAAFWWRITAKLRSVPTR
jgi:undecaprenyl-diphosphatase